MKLFKTIDEKFEEIGFKKVVDNKYEVMYERDTTFYADNVKYGYIHVLTICHKKSGNHIIQSYDKELFDTKGIGNTCVGLTYYETKLILKKMKQKKWHKKGE